MGVTALLSKRSQASPTGEAAAIQRSRKSKSYAALSSFSLSERPGVEGRGGGCGGEGGRWLIPNHSLDDIPVAQPIRLNVRVTQSFLQLLHHVLGAKVRHLQQSRGSPHRPLGNSRAPPSPDGGTWVKQMSVSEETKGVISPQPRLPRGRRPGPSTLTPTLSAPRRAPSEALWFLPRDLQAGSLRPETAPATSGPSAPFSAPPPEVHRPLPPQCRCQPFVRLGAVARPDRPKQAFCGSPASSGPTAHSSCHSPSRSERRASPRRRP